MPVRNNKVFIFILDSLLIAVFFIPLLIERMARGKSQNRYHKILIIELWGIGDLVMMSSILRPLREHYPEASITVLSKDSASELFAYSPYIDEFVVFNFPWTRFRNKYVLWRWDWGGLISLVWGLRNRRFDLVLDARGDIRNNLLSFMINGKRRIGYDCTGGGYLLTDTLRFKVRQMHRVIAWLKLLEYLGVNAKKSSPEITFSKEEEALTEEFLVKNGIRNGELLVGVHPGAQIKSRCWPLCRFAELTEYIRDRLKAKIIVFIEPQGYGDNIPIKGDFIKAKVSLREMAILISRLDFLVCNDSAAMHIASAVNTKTLSIFGPGAMERLGPYGAGHTLLFKENVDCRPCFDYCKFKKPICLEDITVDRAAEAARKNLQERKQLN